MCATLSNCPKQPHSPVAPGEMQHAADQSGSVPHRRIMNGLSSQVPQGNGNAQTPRDRDDTQAGP